MIGSDGSDGAAHAAEWAAHQAPGRATHLRFASYWSLPIAPAVPPVGPVGKYWDVESFASATRDGVRALASRIDELLPDEIEVDSVIAEGQASSHLVAEAADADLLVIGSRGRGGFARLVLGSTSTQCAIHATSPVAVVREAARLEPVSKMVVAFDGSANAIEALRWALDFAADGSSVSVVQVWEPIVVPMGADQFVFVDAVERTRQDFEQQFAEILSASDAERRGVEVTHEFVEGRARHEISERAADADLLVMGARGTGVVGAALLGSVSSWLLHHVETPMVLIPQVDEDDSDVG